MNSSNTVEKIDKFKELIFLNFSKNKKLLENTTKIFQMWARNLSIEKISYNLKIKKKDICKLIEMYQRYLQDV